MPEGILGEPVGVLEELPGEPRLADPGLAGDRDMPGPPLADCCVEEVLEEAQLVDPPHEGRLERLRPIAAAPFRDDPQGTPGGHGGGLALEGRLPGRLEDDRGGGRPLGGFADEDRTRRGDRLEPGGRVDEVAGDHSLVDRPDRDRRFAGENPGPGGDARSERLDRIDDLEAGSHGPLGVILAGDRRTPDSHDRVADELLGGSAVAGDHHAGDLEVPGEGVADVLRVALLGEGGEADEVGEEHRDMPALGDGGGGGREARTGGRCRGRRCPGGEPGRALAAELRVGAVGRSAGRTDQRESSRTFLAELAPRLILGPAARADHPGAPVRRESPRVPQEARRR